MTRRTAAVIVMLAVCAVADGAVAASAASDETDRGSRLQGRAFLGRRQGVVGASVVVAPADEGARAYVTSTDTRGAFRLDGLPDGEYLVELWRDGLRPVRKPGIRVRYPFRAVVELPMVPLDQAAAAETASPGAGATAATIELSGRVLDEDDRPLGDALLRLVKLDAGADPRALRSDHTGRFSLDGLPAGRWELEVRGVGYLPIRAPVTLREAATLRVTLVRQPADYLPTPLELMPPEEPSPPASLAAQSPERRTAK